MPYVLFELVPSFFFFCSFFLVSWIIPIGINHGAFRGSVVSFASFLNFLKNDIVKSSATLRGYNQL